MSLSVPRDLVFLFGDKRQIFLLSGYWGEGAIEKDTRNREGKMISSGGNSRSLVLPEGPPGASWKDEKQRVARLESIQNGFGQDKVLSGKIEITRILERLVG